MEPGRPPQRCSQGDGPRCACLTYRTGREPRPGGAMVSLDFGTSTDWFPFLIHELPVFQRIPRLLTWMTFPASHREGHTACARWEGSPPLSLPGQHRLGGSQPSSHCSTHSLRGRRSRSPGDPPLRPPGQRGRGRLRWGRPGGVPQGSREGDTGCWLVEGVGLPGASVCRPPWICSQVLLGRRGGKPPEAGPHHGQGRLPCSVPARSSYTHDTRCRVSLTAWPPSELPACAFFWLPAWRSI